MVRTITNVGGQGNNVDSPRIAVENIIFGVGSGLKLYDGIQSISDTVTRGETETVAGNRIRHNIVTSPTSSTIEATLVNVVDELKEDLLGYELNEAGDYILTENSYPADVSVSWVNVYADGSKELIVYPSATASDPSSSVSRTSMDTVDASMATLTLKAKPKKTIDGVQQLKHEVKLKKEDDLATILGGILDRYA